MASTSTICRCESALKVSTRWPGLRRVFRGGQDGYSTQLTWPLSSAERVFSFEKFWECYRDFSDSEEEDDGFSPIVGQFIDDNNNDELTENRNINIADVDLEAVL